MKFNKVMMFVYSILTSLFVLMGISVWQWYAILQQFNTDFRQGTTIESYEEVVTQGQPSEAIRRVVIEPPGCRVVVKRYLAPHSDLNEIFYVGEYERQSLPVGQVFKREFVIPDTILPGDYLYRTEALYYCSWLNEIFGPIKTTSTPVVLTILPKVKNE